MQPPQRRGGAFRGLVGGAILIILFIFYRIALRAVNRRIGTRARITTAVTGMQFVFFCAVVILLAALGFLAARRARRLEPGISAAAIAGVLLALVQLGVAVIDAYHARRHGQPSLGSPILTAVKDFIALSLAASGAGTLGGRAGRGAAPEPLAYTPAPLIPTSPSGPGFDSSPTGPAQGSPLVGPFPEVPPSGSYPSGPVTGSSQPPAPPEDYTTMPSLH